MNEYTLRLIYISFSIIWPLLVYSQEKISDKVLELMHDSEPVDCLIIFQKQADLTEANSVKGKIEKGNFVYQRLIQTSTESQKYLDNLAELEGIHTEPIIIINGFRAFLNKETILFLAKLPEIRSIVHNSRVFNQLPRPQSGIQSREQPWSMEFIGADQVWASGIKGQGAVVGGQDTGYDWQHEALIGQYRGYDALSGNADHNYHWWDAIHENNGINLCGFNSQYPCDDYNHGTHTMGTMTGNDGGINRIGVAPEAKWIGCRNMDNGWGTPFTYLECFEWFLAPTDLKGENPRTDLAPHVISNSWSCPEIEGCDPDTDLLMRLAISNLKSSGVVVIVSNGNSGSNCETTFNPPAKFPESFSVGASNQNGIIAGFSSRGPAENGVLKPNVSAPGTSIRSAIPGNQYGNSGGTSMAAPHVAGTIALMISANPNLAGEVASIEYIIQTTANGKITEQECGGLYGNVIPNNTYGYGILNARAAVERAEQFISQELIYFMAMRHPNNQNINLEWLIGPEFLNYTTELQVSTDLSQWYPIARNTEHSWGMVNTFQDEFGQFNKKYYRLMLHDTHYNFLHFSPIRVVYKIDPPVLVYPNPTETHLNIDIDQDEEAQYQISVFNTYGQQVLVRNESITSGKFSLPVNHLNTGFYQILIKNLNSGVEFNAKFMKQ
jgi:serine protease AprX